MWVKTLVRASRCQSLFMLYPKSGNRLAECVEADHPRLRYLTVCLANDLADSSKYVRGESASQD